MAISNFINKLGQKRYWTDHNCCKGTIVGTSRWGKLTFQNGYKGVKQFSSTGGYKIFALFFW